VTENHALKGKGRYGRILFAERRDWFSVKGVRKRRRGDLYRKKSGRGEEAEKDEYRGLAEKQT